MTPRKSAQQSGVHYVVVEGTQVHHDGRLYAAGEEIDVPERDAVQWLAGGLVVAKEGK